VYYPDNHLRLQPKLLSVFRWCIGSKRIKDDRADCFCASFMRTQIHTPRHAWVSLEFPGLENIPQVPPYRAKVAKTHDARKAILSTLSVLKWSAVIFRPRSSKPSVRSFYLCPFHWKLRPSGFTLESLGLENIPQVLANWAKVSQNHDASKAVSATRSVLEWSGAIFRPRSLTPNVRFFYLCPFHWTLGPSGVSLESRGLENILQVSKNGAEVGQNHDAHKALSATNLILK